MAKPLRVLLIEDSEDDALLLLRELRRGGYEPVSQRIETGTQMEEALAQKWDLILSDYSLPHFDPLSALKSLAHRDLDIPFILVSGSVDETMILHAMRSGAADYLMKDNLIRLGPAVDRELREAAARRERRRLEDQVRHAPKIEASRTTSITSSPSSPAMPSCSWAGALFRTPRAPDWRRSSGPPSAAAASPANSSSSAASRSSASRA